MRGLCFLFFSVLSKWHFCMIFAAFYGGPCKNFSNITLASHHCSRYQASSEGLSSLWGMIVVTIWFKAFILTLVLFSQLTLHISCQPFHLELHFFNKANRVLHYPARAFYMDGLNLMAHNLSSGSDSIYRKLYNSVM